MAALIVEAPALSVQLILYVSDPANVTAPLNEIGIDVDAAANNCDELSTVVPSHSLQ